MNTTALRTLMIYAIVLPLAVFVGWMVAGDMTRSSFAVLTAIVFVLLLPFLLKFHYQVLIFSWNTFITIFFLPGEPALWMLMTGITFGIAILGRMIEKRPTFHSVPAVTISLLILAAVVFVTAQLRGGMGIKVFGGVAIGGKGYYLIFAGILGYFALASQTIPVGRAKFYCALFFLPGLISAGSNLIYWAGKPFYFLFALFPVDFAVTQASSETLGSISRLAGFGTAASSSIFYLLCVKGARGVLTKWWLLLTFFCLVALAATAGFRTTVVLIGLTFIALFIAEGLARTALLPVFSLVAILGLAALIPFASHLPNSIQRSLSVIPGLKINPMVKHDADSSTEWRLLMWKAMRPDLPKYFWLGKGYRLGTTDIYLSEAAQRRGRLPNYYSAIVAGNYHNGPLSVYVPFGIFGSLAFVAFLCASLRVLYNNFRWGSDELKMVNRFFFAYFIARVVLYMGAFGSISTDLYMFTGLTGLSVAMNKGMCRKPAAPLPAPVRLRGGFASGSPAPRPA